MSTDSYISSPSSKQSSKTVEHLQNTPNKRFKTLSLDSQSPCSFSKAKSIIGDGSKADSESSICGICLSEDDKIIRGWIDSCEHYFCFVCIMEWAKVESRCPMCKRRFTAIRRPPKDGVFVSERIVNVSVRDQGHHYFGNITIGPPDPYSEVQCSVCHSAENECLLLLCDLCDTASHTFCVGLGATVPEGDWFCHDCTLLREEHAKTETENVSVFDMVREPSIYELPRSSNQSQLSSPVVPKERISVADNVTEPIVGRTATQFNARTLGRCRNVHGHIRALRENWNAFRSGSLSFASSSFDEPTLGASQQSTAQKSSPSLKLHDRDTYDIEKAWKLMDVAKSIQRDCGRSSTVRQVSKHPLRKVSGSKEADNMSTKLLASNSKQLGNKDRGSIRSYCYIEKDNNKHKHPMFEKEKQRGVAMMGVRRLTEGFPTTHSSGICELPSSRKDWASVQVDICHRNVGKPPQESFLGTKPNILIENDGPACLVSPVRSVRANQELHASASSGNFKGKARMEKSSIDSEARRADDAKSEIQSLVKLNLKLLSTNKKLEVVAFKEIARLATHSILAACGLSRPKPGVQSFPSCVCCHVNEEAPPQQLRRSTLMPSSCRECFFVFVKDVVEAIMSEKIACAKIPR